MPNKNLKTVKIFFWVTTLIVALFELSGAFFMNSEMARQGMAHLQIPAWLGWEISIGHIIGGILLIVPVPARIKEWTYVAFGIDFTSAFIGYAAIDGIGMNALSPLIMLALLIVSYITYHKIHDPYGKSQAPAAKETVGYALA